MSFTVWFALVCYDGRGCSRENACVTVQSYTGSGTVAIHKKIKKCIEISQHRYNVARSSGITVPISLPTPSPLESVTVTVVYITRIGIVCNGAPESTGWRPGQ